MKSKERDSNNIDAFENNIYIKNWLYVIKFWSIINL